MDTNANLNTKTEDEVIPTDNDELFLSIER